jgi:peptidoglycan/LPS O-acetylase OafA/YrhL
LQNINSHAERVYGLDILRASAVLFVVYGHGYNLIKDFVDVRYYTMFEFDGVSIFFVLSGFLIGKILLNTINKTEFRIADVFNFWIQALVPNAA